MRRHIIGAARKIFLRIAAFISAHPVIGCSRKCNNRWSPQAIVESRIIPYGIDLSNFHPGDRRAVRAKLGIPDGAKVLLFAANGVRRNPFKDYETMRAAVAQVSERMPSQDVLFITLGEDIQGEQIGNISMRFVPYETDIRVVANYFQAADLYLHAAKADTFPNVVLESLACGTPVIATAVGGIPEQIKRLGDSDIAMSIRQSFGVDEATGVLVKPADAEAMACAIERLLKNETCVADWRRTRRTTPGRGSI